VTGNDYRYRGIGTEFFKAREPVMRAFGLKVTSTICTALGSQKAAANANHKLMLSVDWSEMAKAHPNFDFSKSISKSVNIYDYKIE
jgi:hypothetical protein